MLLSTLRTVGQLLAPPTRSTASHEVSSRLRELLNATRQATTNSAGVSVLPALSAGIVSFSSDGSFSSLEQAPAVTIAHATAGELISGSGLEAPQDAVFHIGSCSKAMSSMAIAATLEAGSSHGQFEHEWRSMTLGSVFPKETAANEAWRELSLPELLAHRAGVNDDTALYQSPTSGPARWRQVAEAVRDQCRDGTFGSVVPLWQPLRALEQSASTTREVRERLVSQVLQEREPGGKRGKWAYSNLGYGIAGAMAERYSGLSYESMLFEYLFEPLGMHSAGLGAPGAPSASAAEHSGAIVHKSIRAPPTAAAQPCGHYNVGGFRAKNVKLRAVDASDSRDGVPAIIAPAGDIHCSMNDWLKFLAGTIATREQHVADMLFEPCGGPVSCLSASSMYGGGWAIRDARVPESRIGTWLSRLRAPVAENATDLVLSHTGSNALWLAYCVVDTANRVAVCAATNASSASGTAPLINLVRAMMPLAYEARPTSTSTTTSSATTDSAASAV